ncbi:MAG: DoxX family protein [Chloroflexi bacterium]|nr:DoxX family protein [Chloroflexota bacterium]
MLEDLLGGFDSWAPLALRIAVGVIFIAHGWPKLKAPKQTAQFVGSIGLRPALFWAMVVGLVEFLGGLGLVVGLLTRWAALFLAINMIGAIVTVKWKKGLVNGYELDLALLAASIALMLTGGGSFSVDANILSDIKF